MKNSDEVFDSVFAGSMGATGSTGDTGATGNTGDTGAAGERRKTGGHTVVIVPAAPQR